MNKPIAANGRMQFTPFDGANPCPWVIAEATVGQASADPKLLELLTIREGLFDGHALQECMGNADDQLACRAAMDAVTTRIRDRQQELGVDISTGLPTQWRYIEDKP